jgi:hypothetical protein
MVSSLLLMVLFGSTVLQAEPVRSIRSALPAKLSPVIQRIAGVCARQVAQRCEARDDKPSHVVAVNHSDNNTFANTSWVPIMRDNWNADNTLAQWRERFGEDVHSALVPVDFRQ